MYDITVTNDLLSFLIDKIHTRTIIRMFKLINTILGIVMLCLWLFWIKHLYE